MVYNIVFRDGFSNNNKPNSIMSQLGDTEWAQRVPGNNPAQDFIMIICMIFLLFAFIPVQVMLFTIWQVHGVRNRLDFFLDGS